MPLDPVLRYIEWMRAKGLTVSLINRRVSFLRAAEHRMGVTLLRATGDDVTRMIAAERKRGLSDATLYTYTGHLGAFYNWAMREGICRRNPLFAAARPRRPKYLPRPIADGPLGLAIDSADDRTRVILVLAALGGLRACEIARLRREDIHDHLDEPMILVHGKGDKPRVVPLSKPLALELHRYGLPRRGPVIRRLDGFKAHVSPSLVSSVANRHLHELSIPDTLHSLRHFTGTVLYRDTKDIQLVQNILGHESPVTAVGYAAWNCRDAPAAMENLAAKVVAAMVPA